MKKLVAEKWVKALRSKKYKQGRNALKMKNNSTGMTRHCCLGVLCELYQQERRAQQAKPLRTATAPSHEVDADLPKGRTVYAFADSLKANEEPCCAFELPKAVASWAGMQSSRGGGSFMSGAVSGDIVLFNGESYFDLASLNDAGCSFAEIADIIEDRVKDL